MQPQFAFKMKLLLIVFTGFLFVSNNLWASDYRCETTFFEGFITTADNQVRNIRIQIQTCINPLDTLKENYPVTRGESYTLPCGNRYRLTQKLNKKGVFTFEESLYFSGKVTGFFIGELNEDNTKFSGIWTSVDKTITKTFEVLKVEDYNNFHKKITYQKHNFNKYSVFKAKKIRTLDLKYKYFKKLPIVTFLFRNLESLDYPYGSFSRFPKQLWRLPNVKSVKLDDNLIVKIPPTIGKMKALLLLQLNNNYISEIPKEIGNLKELRVIQLHNNCIKKIPKEIGELKLLNVLGLGNNNLTTLPDEISKLTNLKFLWLVGNNFSEHEKLRICNMLPNCFVAF